MTKQFLDSIKNLKPDTVRITKYIKRDTTIYKDRPIPFPIYIGNNTNVYVDSIINDSTYIFSVAKIDSPSKTVPLLYLKNVNRELEYWVASEVGSTV